MIRVGSGKGGVSVLTVVSTSIAAICLASALVVAVLVATGRVHVTKGQRAESSETTCGRELIGQYNSLRLVSDVEEHAQVLNDIKARIEALPSAGSGDPTCVYMNFSLSVAMGADEAAIKGYYNTLRSLSDKGLFASSELYDIMSVDDIGASLGEADLPEGMSGANGAG